MSEKVRLVSEKVRLVSEKVTRAAENISLVSEKVRLDCEKVLFDCPGIPLVRIDLPLDRMYDALPCCSDRRREHQHTSMEVIAVSNSYFPANDQQYSQWLDNFVTVLALNAATVGLVPDDLEPIETAKDSFAAKLADYTQKRQYAKAACAAKDTERRVSEEILRPLVKRINGHPGMTDQLRVMLGLKKEEMPQALPPIEQLVPEVYLESRVGLVTVHWGPNPLSERWNGKPSGVKGAVIYRRKTGEPDFRLIGFSTSSPFYDEISGDASDYTYVVRYRGTKTTDLSAPSPAETIAARGDLAA